MPGIYSCGQRRMPGMLLPSSGCRPTIRYRLGLFAQKARYAGDGAGGAHAGDKVGDAPVRSGCQISGPVVV